MAGTLVAHTHVCLAGFGKLLKEWVILGGDILNSINTPRNRHTSFAECVGQSGDSLTWGINVLGEILWPMELSRGSAQDGLGEQCKSASAVTPVLVWPLGKPCEQCCPWGQSPAADSPWLWAAACRMFPAVPAALQWKHSLVGAVPWARELRRVG